MERRGRSNMKGMRLLVWLALVMLMGACASMGRPEGGTRDIDPPKFLHSDPAPGSRNVNKTKLTAYFDENIQLEDAFNKVVVSPPQKQTAKVTANGHRLYVDLGDSLKANTTYTIDFADAIKDLNEGNILDGFAIDFSTGSTLDSLRISGMVLQAENLEPAQGMLVGVYSNLSDTALTTLPLERIARTNQLGQFTIRNLAPGQYRVFAINDVNHDNHWDRSEDIAFFDELVVPSMENINVTDTLYSSTGEDSLVTHGGVRYLPNDILLTWFNENYKPHYLADYKRPERRKFTITLGAPADTLPTITIVDGAPGAGRKVEEWALMHANPGKDSLEYWIADPEVLAADSLRLAVTYQKNDSLDRPVWTTDTLRFFFKDKKEKKEKKKKKKEDEEPRFIVDSITGDTTFLPPADMEYLQVSIRGGSQDLNKPVTIETNLPLASLDTAAIHLETFVDSVWKPLPVRLRPDTLNPLLRRFIDYKWEPGEKYRVVVDSLAATSIYGPWNKAVSAELNAKKLEEYSNLKIELPGTDSINAIVEVLTSSDATAYRSFKPAGTSVVNIELINPGTYYLRLVNDANGNGKWDTGNVADSIQPEEVFYFAKKIDLKANWDVEQVWDIYELPIDLQKPYAIKKNKPKLKRGEKAPQDETDEDEDAPWGGGMNQGFGGNNRNNSRPGFGGRPARL